MALMIGKFLEIKTGLLLLYKMRDIVWNVQKAQTQDKLTGETITLRTNLDEYQHTELQEVLKSHFLQGNRI